MAAIWAPAWRATPRRKIIANCSRNAIGRRKHDLFGGGIALVCVYAAFICARLAITFRLPHLRHRNRLTNWLIGAVARRSSERCRF